MKHKMKQAISLLCALVLVVTSCFVEEAMTATASETNSNDVVRYVNPAIPVNVGETIDLTKYDVELSKDEATASTELTWYGQVETNTVPYTAPAIGVNVGETINLANYKVEFEKGVSSFVDTWKNDNTEITTFTAETTGITTLTAISGENSKSIYVVAKNPEDTEYVLYRNDFESKDDLSGLTQVTNNAATVTYSVSNGALVIARSGSKWQESHLLLPAWLGDFGDYHVEIKTNITNQASNTSYVGIDMRMQNESYPYYCAMMRYNKTYALNYRDASNTWASDSATYNNPNKAAAIDNVTTAFVFEAEMQGDTFSLKVNGNETLSTTNKKLYDTGRIAIFANSVVPNVDYVEVTMIPSKKESATETAKITSFTPNETGVTELTVKDSEGNEKVIYVVAKNPEDSEWVLYENDFNSGLEGIELVEGTPNSAVVDKENGQFNLDIKWRGNYRFPEWLGDFGNYRIEMTETCTSYASSNNRISLFARGQENNKYTPNYTVKLRYKGWDWDSVLLTKRLAWTDSATNWQWEDIAWGKYGGMETNTSYTHEMNVQDDLIEYKINDETILYDIRERDLSTGHVGFMFDGNGNSDKISIDSVRVVFCPDMTAPEAPTTSTYKRTTNAAGMADGKVEVSLSTKGSAAKDVVCYWGDGQGKLAGYTNFAKALVEEGATSITVNLGENIMIPKGATELRVYTENIAGESENCVCVPLPDGVSALETGNEVISFQVISDTHIKADNTHYNTTHLQTFLSSVSANDPNSVGIFVGGDLVDNGTEAEYQNFQNIWKSVEGLPEMYAVIGNHEFWNGDWNATMEMFYEYTGTTEPYYHKEVNGYDFIFLASTEEESASPTNAILGSAQLTWLEKTLEEQAETDKPIFVFLHQPLNNTVAGSTDKDVQESEEVKAILAEYPQAFLFTSHSHMNLDTPGTMIAADGTVCNLFNTAAVSYLMNTHYTSRNFMSEEAQGYYVEVYEDKVLVRGKNLLTDEWLPSAQFVVSFDNEYGFEITIGGSSVGYLDEAFDVYQYNKPTTKDNTYAIVGPVEPSQKDPNSNSGTGGATYFTTQYYGNASRYGLKPTYIPGGNGQGGYTVLTYTETDVTDFEAEYEFYGSWGRAFGLAFGGQPGVFPVSLDNDNTNDIGVGLYMEANGKLFVYGAINTENITKSSDSITVATGSTYGNVVPGTANMNATGMTGSDSISVDESITASSKTFTVCVKVAKGVLTVYEKNHKNLSVSIPLTDNYKGGYVSLIANAFDHGAFKSFNIKPIKAWDYDMSIAINGSSVSYLNDAFDVYQFNKPATAVDTTSVTGPVEPSATDPNSYNGGYSYFTTKAYGNYSKGGLKPTYVPSSGYTMLTYTKDTVEDFEAEYDYYPSWSTFGLVFGGELGTFPLSLDSDNTNDTGVALYMSDNGTLYVYGAIDTENVKATTGVKVDKNITSAATMLNTANLRATGMTNGESIAVDANGGTLSTTSDYFTLCIKVEDGILTIHEKDHPGTTISVALANTYVGGHVSLMSNQTQHGAFGGFRISKLTQKYNVSALGLAGLNNYFDSYYFEDNEVVKGTVSSQWFLNPASAPDTYEGYYQNWALKPNHRNSGTKTSLLTLKDKTVTNFEASVEYITAHTAYGLIVAPEGELPKANEGLKLSVTSEGRILVDGAIDVDSASWSGDGKCSSTGVFGIKGPALNGYIAPASNWSSSDANKTSYVLNVKVQDGVLTASVEGFEGELTVNLTANYVGGSISIYSNGYDQGGFKNFVLNELEDTKRIANAQMPFVVVSNGDYATIDISTDVEYSILSGTFSYDAEKFEYAGAVFADKQDVINLDTTFSPSEGTISLEMLANAAGDVVSLHFKRKVDVMDYTGFVVTNARIFTCGGVEVAKVASPLNIPYDYTENKVIDIRDLVRGKKTVLANPDAVRKVLVGKSVKEVSPLVGKSALYLGDSIAYGAADSLYLSWGGRIARKGMTYENVAVSGWALTNRETSGRGQIVTQLDKASKDSYDFVILEGGVNDVLMMQSSNKNITWGEITADGTTYDDATIAGAIEDLIVKTKAKFPNAIVGYVINNYFGATDENMAKYIETVKQACDKHEIAYLDLNADERTGSEVFNKGCQYLPDNLHPNAAGYDIIAPVIAEWMEGLVSGTVND